MIVDISKIKIKERIRKDFGDIKELADDIKQNGLINPPVVNRDYELLAGERRLRACKSLGWQQIEVRMMDTRDADHDFEIEVSENENRKDFSRVEREEVYTRYIQMRLQQSGPIGPRVHAVELEAAKLLGTSRTNMNREREIIANRDFLDPADFADWDEGKLSTNKAFQKIKAEKDRAKAEMQDLREERDYLQSRVEELQNAEPQVIERTIEVVPDDYETAKTQAKSAEKARKETLQKLREAEARINDLEERKDISELQKKLEEEAGYFTIRTYDYIQKNGGFVWITERLEQLPESQRKEFVNTVYAIDAFAKQMVQNIGGYGIE